MLVLKVALKDAEKWKNYLKNTDNFNNKYRFKKDKKFIFFPIKKKFEIIKSKAEFLDIPLESAKIVSTLKEVLSKNLSDEELNILTTAYDIIGTIAILEIPKKLENRERFIAETLLKTNKSIKTVLKKAASHEGIFRTQKMKYLAGVDTKETVYRENNVLIKLDVEKVYFSIRLSNERKRIINQVKSGENILVMFSGCAPYPIALSKNTQAKQITGIEINPDGHKYGLENIELNKCKNIELICADVHDMAPILSAQKKKFNRIIMPLPKTADEFLDDALVLSKKNTIIHFYDFLSEKNFDDAKNKIDVACKKNNIKYHILDIIKCGQHAPHVFRICVDFVIV